MSGLGEAWILLVWGTAVGLDLVSLPQAMIARPLVAGPVAGLLLGDPQAGLLLGVVFELMQYDILPVGAARYPEYGPATVAAVAAAHDIGGSAGVALGTVVGLATALAGGASLNLLRRLNTRAVTAAGPLLESGDRRALTRVHAAGLARDAVRAAAVTALGLALAWIARRALLGALPAPATALVLAATGGVALAAGTAGVVRLVGHGLETRWLAAGLVGGLVLVWLR